MNIIICVDKNNGTFFNGRRQSLDREIAKKIASMTEQKAVWMKPYSAELFDRVEKLHIYKRVDERYLDRADGSEYCFVEGDLLKPYLEKINTIIVFRWDRIYPADQYLDISLSNFEPVVEMGFHGYSPELITMEMYKKKDTLE